MRGDSAIIIQANVPSKNTIYPRPFYNNTLAARRDFTSPLYFWSVRLCVRQLFPPSASFHPLMYSLDSAGRLATNLDVEENLWVDAAERRGLLGRATAPHVGLASTVSLFGAGGGASEL